MTPISLPVAELKLALTGLGKIIPRQSTLPVLQCLHIERTADGWVCLSATDLDRYVTVRLEQPAEGEPCAMLVHFDDLVRVAKACARQDSIRLEPTSPKCVSASFALAGKIGMNKLRSLPVDEYPDLPRIVGDPVPLPASFRTALLEAMDCTSKDHTRPVLEGVFIDVSVPDAHYVVGTDGKHLYSCNSLQLALPQSLVIPRHKFLVWREFQADGEWRLSVGVHQGQDHVQVSSRRWRFTTRVMDQPYPGWRQVIPADKQFKTAIRFDPQKLEGLLHALERLEEQDDEFRSIGIEWRGGKVQFLYPARAGKAWEEVAVPGASGQGAEVTVFCNRLLLLKALRFGLLELDLIDEISPLRFREGGRRLIVMPVRVKTASEPPPAPVNAPAARHLPPIRSTNLHPVPDMKPTLSPAPPADPRPQPTAEPGSPRLEDVLESLDQLRDSCTKSLSQIKDLSGKLRLIRRDQRSSQRGLQTVRHTLRSLQGIRF
jgi:DNA polymerase III sliding clamp (beta) subunit (PCNA family)